MGRKKFSQWLLDAIEERGWSQAELARRSGMSPAHISRIISELQKPGVEACAGIARALNLPIGAVIRAARPGMLPPQTEHKAFEEEVIYRIRSMDKDERMRLAEYLKYLEYQRRIDENSDTIPGDAEEVLL